MKKLLKNRLLWLIIILLSINQIYYLTSLQFTCTDKINNGDKLNVYETLSAVQTHFNMGLFGFVVEPSTALSCIEKQFHINTGIVSIPKDDTTLANAKQKLDNNETNEVRLAWKNYSSRASILLNGSTISNYWDDGKHYYLYEINFDYKPGIIKIWGITISETVFDYLENVGILSIMKKYTFQ